MKLDPYLKRRAKNRARGKGKLCKERSVERLVSLGAFQERVNHVLREEG